MKSVFTPRKHHRASSEKHSTVRNREREYRLSGLSAALSNLKSKWRKRKSNALAGVRKSGAFRELHARAPDRCAMHMQWLIEGLHRLRDAELEETRKLTDRTRAAGRRRSSSLDKGTYCYPSPS